MVPPNAGLKRSSAGVIGGVPFITNIADTIGPNDDLQSKIDNTSEGVIVLKAGTYQLNKTINLKSNIVLRGIDKNTVIFKNNLTARASQNKKNGFYWGIDVKKAALENLTITNGLTTKEPIEKSSLTDGWFCGDCFSNDPYGIDSMYVRHIFIDGDQNWLDNVNLLYSGSDPIQVSSKADHNTFRGLYVDHAYNKGGSGNGYFDLRGDYNLVVNSTIKRIRHFAVQQDAEYNVILNNYLEVDINFHNGDAGK